MFFLFFLVLPSLLQAQQTAAPISIPMKNGIVFYEKEYILPKERDIEKAAGLAVGWIKKTFPSAVTSILAEGHTRKIQSTGTFKVPVSESGNYFWVRMKISISFDDSGYRFQMYDYYEKPVEKGVSNEYSKIEYRWWDFRKGKPWSPEDNTLFEGIHQRTLGFMESLASVMK